LVQNANSIHLGARRVIGTKLGIYVTSSDKIPIAQKKSHLLPFPHQTLSECPVLFLECTQNVCVCVCMYVCVCVCERERENLISASIYIVNLQGQCLVPFSFLIISQSLKESPVTRRQCILMVSGLARSLGGLHDTLIRLDHTGYVSLASDWP
jgi:hypothetical protein